MSQRQPNNLPSQLEPNPKKEDVDDVMTRSKRIQEDSEEKEGSSSKVADDVLTKEDQTLEKIEDPTNGNPIPKKEGEEKGRDTNIS